MVIDEELKQELDAKLLPWDDVTVKSMFGGACFMVNGKMFAIQMDGTLAMKLPEELRQQALGLAGVSPFYADGVKPFGVWIQFVLILSDNVEGALPWLQQAYKYVASLPAPKKRKFRNKKTVQA